MGILSSIIGTIALISGLFAPMSAMAALGFSFGGRLISPPVPCFHLPGAFLISILPAGGDPNPFYIYTTGLTKGLPPIHPGQQILGVADIFLACNGIPAQRIQLDGVGL